MPSFAKIILPIYDLCLDARCRPGHYGQINLILRKLHYAARQIITMKFLAIPVVILAVTFGFLFTNNPMLFGKRTGESHEGFKIYKHAPELDDELLGLAEKIGKDFTGYRNHCLRVLTFTKYFLPDFVEKELPSAMDLAAVAVAYHDVGLWTDKALNYLDPSVAQLEKTLSDKHNAKEIEIMKAIIMEHHKLTGYSSDQGKAADALVNAVRKADWADFSMGIVRFGMPAALVEAAYDNLADRGFHKALMGLGSRLSPGDVVGQLEVLKIFKW